MNVDRFAASYGQHYKHNISREHSSFNKDPSLGGPIIGSKVLCPS